jgi:cell division protein FtsW (lipid II flippase)
VLGWLGLGRDGVLLAGATALVCLGLTVLGRVAAEYTGAGRAEVLAHLAPRHLAWFGVGLAGMVAGAWLGRPRRLARLARKKYLLPLAAAGLLVLTWLVGPEINRRRLWLVLGPFTLQTVELAKVLVVLFAAGYFADEYPFLLERRRAVGLEGLTAAAGPFAVMLGLPLLALFVQRDFGPAVLLGLFFLAMVYLATGAGWLPAAGLGLVVLAGAAGYHLGVPAMLQARVEAWLEPFHTSEQLARGLWSIAAGGLWGSGWGLGHPHSVPLAYSDFVFAALAEETGLVGGTAALALTAVLVIRCLVVAGRSRAAQARLAAAGVGVMQGLQTLLVTAGVTGLIPLAGLTLPLVSHGGSSLVVNLTLLGLAMGAAGREG